mmetsp:Transcript_49133/g.122053  ORF Transcript_49133/g.122053 Transcript_49133/m.122053 type:complete len:320 (+) Transcript_49133:305-1264(+)
MLDSPRSSSPTSPVTEPEQKGWQCLYFCRFPGCNKGYASTDGVRKHCRKHHAEWLADLDNTMRENNQKHSAANYCSTQPAEGVEPPLPNSRKRPRADSGTSSIGGTPTGTPRLDPSVPPRIDAAPTPMALEEARGAPPQQEATTLLVRPVKLPVKEDTIKEEAVFACGWPSFSEDGSLGGVRAEAPDRTLLSALAALDEGSTSWPYRSTRERSEPLVDNFFSLGSGMPAPKRGFSLTSDAMAELQRECENESQKMEGALPLRCAPSAFTWLKEHPLARLKLQHPPPRLARRVRRPELVLSRRRARRVLARASGVCWLHR